MSVFCENCKFKMPVGLGLPESVARCEYAFVRDNFVTENSLVRPYCGVLNMNGDCSYYKPKVGKVEKKPWWRRIYDFLFR